METADKLALLGGAARYEIASERQVHRVAAGPSQALCMGETPGGAGTLLRVLQSSRCEHDCAYCPLRRSNDPERASFSPDELAGAFTNLWQKGKVSGLMLSSATDGTPDQSMARMLDTIRLLRTHHAFDGYIHLKVLPGASIAALDEAAGLADRLSLNVETPIATDLTALQTGKRWEEDILAPLRYLRELDQQGRIHSGITSQLLVGLAPAGVTPASDQILAHGSRNLPRAFNVRRVHFGSFVPAPGTPLAEAEAPDPRRRARLYQWEWLATQYGYADAELDAAFDPAGNMPLALDPKLAVTLARPSDTLTEVNTASYEELLRVPGIGPVSARRILELRHLGPLRDLQDLRIMGIVADRAAPFVLLNGRRPPEAPATLQRLRRKVSALGPRPRQLSLWPEML
jgi:predicted DNA-binding helix-hairpin-helix protein